MNNLISLAISRHKIELMGMAICMIIFFHSEIKFESVFLNFIKDICDMGVDIFMLLSGFSLAYSYHKRPDLYSFGKKRFVRILPTYLVVFSLVYLYDDIIRHDTTWGHYLYDLFFLNFFIDGSIYIWFIPVIIVYYILLPWYIKLCSNAKIVTNLPYLLIVLIVIFLIFHIPLKHFFLWVRMPIFLIGANLYFVNKKNILAGGKILLGSMAAMAIIVCCIVYYSYPTMFGIKYLLYIPVVLWIVCMYRIGKYHSACLAFLGGITLELYLLHERIQWLADNFISNQYILCVFAITLSVILATILHKAMNRILDKIFAR